MSDLYNQIVSQRGSFENLLARMPGFGGYIDKASRRTADRMVRDHIADLLTQRIDRFSQIQKKVLSSGGLSSMGKMQGVQMRMQTFRDRVKNSAAPGYTGAGEAIKVGSEELEHLYSFDEALIRYADKYDEALNALDETVSANQPVDDALGKIDQVTTEASEAFTLRENVLTNLSKSLSA